MNQVGFLFLLLVLFIVYFIVQCLRPNERFYNDRPYVTLPDLTPVSSHTSYSTYPKCGFSGCDTVTCSKECSRQCPSGCPGGCNQNCPVIESYTPHGGGPHGGGAHGPGPHVPPGGPHGPPHGGGRRGWRYPSYGYAYPYDYGWDYGGGNLYYDPYLQIYTSASPSACSQYGSSTIETDSSTYYTGSRWCSIGTANSPSGTPYPLEARFIGNSWSFRIRDPSTQSFVYLPTFGAGPYGAYQNGDTITIPGKEGTWTIQSVSMNR